MKIIEKTTEFRIGQETAVAIGKFDGFHRGHQKLLNRIKEQKERGLAAVVFTFVPSPAAFFSFPCRGRRGVLFHFRLSRQARPRARSQYRKAAGTGRRGVP